MVISNTTTAWPASEYCLSAAADEPSDHLAGDIYARVCRTDFEQPGFCLVNLGSETDSQSLRRFMLALKRRLQQLHKSRAGRDLVFVSAARFDQQVTTKLHRDGGPDESLLMLGYEPSPVAAEVAIADYSRAACDLDFTPAEFLERRNPMFRSGEELLRPYTTHIECFSRRRSQVLLINNSVASYAEGGGAWQGVLHAAAVRNPDDKHRRVVNSTMLAPVPLGADEPVSEAEQEAFAASMPVRRRGYDRTHLEDEA